MATTYEPGYPVNFYAGGDTTREAFSKHIQEILKIYGILNALQSTKADSTAVTKAIEDAKTLLTDKIATTKTELTDALTNHINSTDPHPNLQLTTLKGNLPASRVSGTLSESQLPYISSSKITGNFGTSQITGLEAMIKNSSTPLGTINKKKGYMQFSNGFTMQWDITDPNETHISETTTNHIDFNKTFTTLFAVYTQMYSTIQKWDSENRDITLRILNQSLSGFDYIWDVTTIGASSQDMYMSYLALGIIN